MKIINSSLLLFAIFTVFSEEIASSLSLKYVDCRLAFCRPNQRCVNGRGCVPKDFYNGPDCRLIRCSSGFTCIDGKGCVKNEVPKPNCMTIKCSAGYICVNGTGCVRDTSAPSCAAVLCPVNSTCKNGKCYPLASECGSGSVCTDGYCLPSSCRPCPRGAQCFAGPTCPGGFKCQNSRCVRDCDIRQCAPGMMCIQGFRCQDIQDGIRKCDN